MKKSIIFSFIISILVTSCTIVNGHILKPKLVKVISPNHDKVNLVTNNNKNFQGTIVLPNAQSKKITIETEAGKVELLSNEVNFFYAWNPKADESKATKFIFSPTQTYSNPSKTNETKISQNKYWLMQVRKSNTLEVFILTKEYDLLPNGEAVGSIIGNGVQPDVWYFFLRKGEEIPTTVMLSPQSAINSNSFFIKFGSRYFSDCAPLVEKIKNKVFTDKNIDQILDFYDSWKGNN